MRLSRRPAVVAAVLTLLGASQNGRAQSIHGVIVDGGERPIVGAVLQLLDSTTRVTSRALSNERGEYWLNAVHGGTYRIRTLRIGFRPYTSDPIPLGASEDLIKRMRVVAVSIALDTMKVVGRNACREFRDSSAATFAVWEQVRTALTAAQMTSRARISGSMVAYQRVLEPQQLRLLKQNSQVSATYVNEPWYALAPDSLHKVDMS
ncbi:MAG: carboxypeptidase-like regulatory domain-containing protein [bacterium]